VALPANRASYCLLLTGYDWQAVSDYESARRCFERVNPETAPGAWFGLAVCVSGTDPQQALQYANQYEAALGPNALLSAEKARMLTRLNRSEESLAAWKQVARLQPDNIQALSRIVIALPEASKNQIEPWLQASGEPASLAAKLANRVAYEDIPSLNYLVEPAARNAPDSPETLGVLGLRASVEGQHNEAVEFYAKAMTAEKEEIARNSHVRSFLYAQVQCDRLINGYRTAPDQQFAFEYLANAWEESDIEISREEFSQLLNLHLKNHPNELQGIQYAADFAIEEKEFKTAEELIDRALASDAA